MPRNLCSLYKFVHGSPQSLFNGADPVPLLGSLSLLGVLICCNVEKVCLLPHDVVQAAVARIPVLFLLFVRLDCGHGDVEGCESHFRF